MKKNRRSQRNKAEKFKEKSEYLLANFTWNKEERILLELMVEGSFSMNDIREANWTQVSEGIKSVFIKNVELFLSDETVADFKAALTDLIDFDGNEIDPRDTLHKIFTHNTGKEVSKTLLSHNN